MASVKQQFADVKSLLDQVHSLVDTGSHSDISKAASILKSILPVYKDLSSNEESKRPENLEILKEIKIRLAEETSRVMAKKEETKKYQEQNSTGAMNINNGNNSFNSGNQMMSGSFGAGGMMNNSYKGPSKIEMMKPPLLQGYLKKQGEKGLVKGFKKRWFQQKDTKLYYYEKEGDTNSYGFINLPDMLGVKTVDQGFELATPTRVYVLQVMKPSDLNYWTEGLKEYKKYYSSLTNNQKFGLTSGANDIPITSQNNNRPLANTVSSDYLQSAYMNKQDSNQNFNNGQVNRDLRRGTVSIVESQFNSNLTNRDDLSDDDDNVVGSKPISNNKSNANSNNLSSSYNPTSSIDEGLKKREEELRKRFLEQKQQEEQSDKLRLQEEQQKKQEQDQQKIRDEQARQIKEQKDREQEDFKKQEDERERQRSILFQQQEEEIKKRLSMQVDTNNTNSSNSNNSLKTSDNNIQPINNNDNQNNFSSNHQSPSLTSSSSNINTNTTSNMNNTSSASLIDLDLIKKNIEDELRKKFLQQQDEILEIERQRRNDLEKEIKRLKDLYLKTQSESKTSDSLQMDLQMNNDEIDRLKREVKDTKEQVQKLEKANKELSVKPQDKFHGEYKWIEEITSRDKQIIQFQSKIRELDETLKLNENAVSSIQRENEMLREETEKKDRYITELMEKSKDSQSLQSSGSLKNQSQNRRGSMDVTKLKEALSAHQSQNSFLMAEIQRLENDSVLKLEIKDQHIDDLSKQIDETINQFHSFRSFLLGNSSPKEYYDKVEKENLDIKKEYFHTLGVSIKLHRAREGQNSNIDIHSLYENAIKSNVYYKSWPTLISENFQK